MSQTFEAYGGDATSLGQCPYDPGTSEWKFWQKDFARRQQSRDSLKARREAGERAAEAGLTLHEPTHGTMLGFNALQHCKRARTEAQVACGALMDELENGPPRPTIFVQGDQGDLPIGISGGYAAPLAPMYDLQSLNASFTPVLSAMHAFTFSMQVPRGAFDVLFGALCDPVQGPV